MTGGERVCYIELRGKLANRLQSSIKPQVLCESEQIAKRVMQQINYAKVVNEQLRHYSREFSSDRPENHDEYHFNDNT